MASELAKFGLAAGRSGSVQLGMVWAASMVGITGGILRSHHEDTINRPLFKASG